MLRDKWGGVRWLSFSELLKHEASELKCWHLNFKWEEMLVNTGLFSAVGQLPQISMFSFFSFYYWVNYNAECQSSSLLNFHLDGTLPNVSSIFFSVPPHWAGAENSTEMPIFFFNYLQYDARFVMCHLISFIGIYCPPAVRINAHFQTVSCQAAFLDLLCIYTSSTLFPSHHYL